MDTRREFVKKSVLLSGAAGLSAFLPASVQRAFAIDPQTGSTYLDAEHVVVLMQENRSFDHCFGSMQGVRGFNDPRAITLPDGKPVWLQTDAAGRTFAPFRLNIADTKVTWMGDLPHSRASQVDANNVGKHDQWLIAKKPSHNKYSDMPLTLGHYSREDLPFNYALADAFTVCDQHFCSAMTSTWPNRLYLWTGNVRHELEGGSKATMRNDLKYGEAKWTTFPERLEEKGISWNVYQNEITAGGGFKGEERSWLSNFGCNPLEWFDAYKVRFSPRYHAALQRQSKELPEEIDALKTRLAAATGDVAKKIETDIRKKEEVLATVKEDLLKWDPESFKKLTARQKSLFEKAFSKNDGDPNYHEIETLMYSDNNTERKVTVPKGDILHRFRDDVNNGKLPTVSWLVGPQNFSDHPSAPWYGAWYVSEVLDILTKNPEVWKKTIFILTYDENDGYYDHIPPFLPPDPKVENSGKCSKGIDTEIEFIRKEREVSDGIPPKQAREGAIGLGNRVPLVIASPWSRGGKVCSEIFDHTSALQFLEKFLNQKFKVDINETNISKWRRTVCGDLTSVFEPYNGEKPDKLPFLEMNPFIEKIHKAQFKKEPSDYRQLTAEEIEQISKNPSSVSVMPAQEKGVRKSCPLPYELQSEGALSSDKKQFEITLHAGNKLFGEKARGTAFRVHAPGKFTDAKGSAETGRTWFYAVEAGDQLADVWPVSSFADGNYHLRVYGPNGFFREFMGNAKDPSIQIHPEYEMMSAGGRPSGGLVMSISNEGSAAVVLKLHDHYSKKTTMKTIPAGAKNVEVKIDTTKYFGWYDISVAVNGMAQFEKRYAGKVETGKATFTDPAMGRTL